MEVYSNTIPPQKTGKILNRQPNLKQLETEEQRKHQNQQKVRNNKDMKKAIVKINKT